MSWNAILMFLMYGTVFKLGRGAPEIFYGNLTPPVNNEMLPKGNESTCKTKVCEIESGSIKKWLKESIDPCDNFYEFACGNEDFVSGFGSKAYTEVSSKTQNQMIQILSEPLHSNDAKAIRLTKSFYQSCVFRSAWDQSGNCKQNIAFAASATF